MINVFRKELLDCYWTSMFLSNQFAVSETYLSHRNFGVCAYMRLFVRPYQNFYIHVWISKQFDTIVLLNE